MQRQSRRSQCPIAFSLDLFGDRWTLLILRDMVFMGHRYFRDFLESGEGIATNVLSERLGRLERAGIIFKKRDSKDRRRNLYLLTEPGLDMIPILLELIVWGANHDPRTPVTEGFLRRIHEERERVILEYRNQRRAG